MSCASIVPSFSLVRTCLAASSLCAAALALTSASLPVLGAPPSRACGLCSSITQDAASDAADAASSAPHAPSTAPRAAAISPDGVDRGADGASTAADRAAFAPQVFALELDVPDLERAMGFYRDAFGFEESRALSTSRLGVLECDGGALVLRPSQAGDAPRGAPAWSLSLRVSDLDLALDRARAAGATVEDATPRRIPIGRAISIADPFGHAIHLIDVDGDAPERACCVYDFGASAADIAAVERDFAHLGFEAATREFLPGALPLAKHGRTPLVLHAGATASVDTGARGERLVLAVESLEPALAELESLGVHAPKAPFSSGSLGRGVALRTETGLALRVLERSPSELAFERLRGLAGEWEGTSDHGWSSRIRIEVIAGGSAVLETTAFEAHPGETMLTLFHKDGPRLFLTHYCVAGNQPRLCAQRFDDGGATVTFEYFDGTNLASRDQGHMDRAVFRFTGDDAFSSTWNWYQDGKEGWKEAIEYRRASGSGAAPAANAGADGGR